jgi:hypothetical protein
MKLRNPDVNQAIASVQLLQSQLGSARGSGHSSTDRRDAFLSWCDYRARPQLGNHFSSTETLFGELDQSYDRVALAPGTTERTLNGILQREFNSWEGRLERLVAELRALAPFIDRPGRIVVLDTSALMEGQPFASFNWQSLDTSLADSAVRLIVPVLVIEELDELKRDRDGARKQKARGVFRSLWGLHGHSPTEPVPLPEQSGVTIEVMLDGDWHQRRLNNDGEIIDQAVQVRELTGKPVILASGDYAQLYRSAAAGLQAVLMPRLDET